MWTRLKRLYQSEHQWAAQQLSAYLDDELSLSDRARVEAHLRGCQACREELNTLRWTVRLTAQMPKLKAPRSFLITEALVQPRRTPSMAYQYLRGATMAVAALLLIVLVSDLLLPYAFAPRAAVSQPWARQAAPAAAEALADTRVVVKAIPVEKQIVVEKEVVKEVSAEEEAEPAATPMATPVPPKEVLGAGRLGPAPTEVEQVAEEDRARKPMALMAPSTEQVLEAPLVEGEQEAMTTQDLPMITQELPMKEGVATAPATASAPVTAVPTPTSPPLYHTAETEAARSLRPTPLPPAAATAEVAEPLSRAATPWRPILRTVEVGLASLVILLIGGMLIIRPRRR